MKDKILCIGGPLDGRFVEDRGIKFKAPVARKAIADASIFDADQKVTVECVVYEQFGVGEGEHYVSFYATTSCPCDAITWLFEQYSLMKRPCG